MLHSRLKRVEELVARTLAELLLTEVKDDRLRAASVTGVRVSKDLRHAVVMISCLKAGGGEELIGALSKAKGWLRTELGHRVSLRYTPELRFVLDDSVAKSAHIEELLRQARSEEEQGE